MSKLNLKSQALRGLVGAFVAGLLLGGAGTAHAEKVSYTETILPIMKERCYSCHGGTKDKGDLKLDSLEAFVKGGEDGVIFVAGKPEESSLYKLIILPGDDPDIMPAKGDTLTKEQIKAISDWISQGADFGDWKGEDEAPAAEATVQSKN